MGDDKRTRGQGLVEGVGCVLGGGGGTSVPGSESVSAGATEAASILAAA